MYLPKVIKYNAREKAAADRYVEISRFISLPAKTAEEGVASLIGHIKTLNKALDIPGGIKDYEGGIINEKEFLDKLPKVAELAVGGCLYRFKPPEDHSNRNGEITALLLLRYGS
jgi:alcohol dehydrogenase class IV